MGTTVTNKKLDIQTRFRDVIHNLREFSEEYESLSEDQKRSVRHTLYRQEGKFAKIFFEAMKPALPKIVAHQHALQAQDNSEE